MAEDHIDNWYGKPIGTLSRGELIDALDWCVKELRRYQQEENLEDAQTSSARLGAPGL